MRWFPGPYNYRMRLETALTFWHLDFLSKRRYELLRREFGTLDVAIGHLGPELIERLNVTPERRTDVLERLRRCDIETLDATLVRHGMQLLTIEDATYPPLLREVSDPPIFLSAMGDVTLLQQTLIAIVGTRRMNPYGRRLSETFIPPLTAANLVTVSGLALGIDAAVALDTLQAGGRHIAVLGNGLPQICPRQNERLGKKIIAQGGLLVSELPPDTIPTQYSYPQRNRIIAGLSCATLVLQAPIDSGAIITADLAIDYNRDVFAVPGQVFDDASAGCHMLIGQGKAALVSSPEDLLQAMGILHSPTAIATSPFSPGSDDEHSVYTALTSLPQTVDDLGEKTQLSAPRIATALTMIELAQRAKHIGGGQWVRV